MGPRPADTVVKRGLWVEFRSGVPLAALGGGEGVSPGLKQTEVGGWRGNLAWCPRMPQRAPVSVPRPLLQKRRSLMKCFPFAGTLPTMPPAALIPQGVTGWPC